MRFAVLLMIGLASPVLAQSVELRCEGDRTTAQYLNGDEVARQVGLTGRVDYRVDIVDGMTEAIAVRRDGIWVKEWTECSTDGTRITCRHPDHAIAEYLIRLETSTKRMVQLFKQKKQPGQRLLVETSQVMQCR